MTVITTVMCVDDSKINDLTRIGLQDAIGMVFGK